LLRSQKRPSTHCLGGAFDCQVSRSISDKKQKAFMQFSQTESADPAWIAEYSAAKSVQNIQKDNSHKENCPNVHSNGITDFWDKASFDAIRITISRIRGKSVSAD